MSIFFKSALPYRLTQQVELFGNRGLLGEENWVLHDRLNRALNEKASRIPGTMELNAYGFVEPYPNEHKTLAEVNEEPTLDLDPPEPELRRLVRPIANGNFLVICTALNYRQLPGIVVRNEVKERVAEIEAKQMRKVYKKERDQLKDEAVAKLLPQAFILQRRTYAIIDTVENLIWVQSASAKAAEDLLSTLRTVLGSLPVRPLTVKIAPSATFTDWVKTGKTPPDFYLLDSVLLEDTHEDGGKVGAMRQDLTSEAIQLHVAEGKIATKIAIAYKDMLGFVVNDKVQFTKIRFSDYMDDRASQNAGDGGTDNLHDASYYLLGTALREVLQELLPHLGGESIPEGI